ncbi:MAG TPA: sigma-70 family RNA polymerase sigma factor [Acidimicrobiales bacterium]|nr:sigma-70 family RNA polymerase sigma factor [Acidimicrobiales bacterium]
MDREPDGGILTQLLVAARDGDPVALGAFARATYRDIWRFCAALADEPGRADDLTNDVFVRVLRALPHFRGESTARTWLFSIARRTVADAIREGRRRRRLNERISRQPPEGPASEAGGLVELVHLLGGLDHDRRAAFVLTQIVGLSYAEAAEVCACAVGTIRSRVARARSQLLQDLRPVIDDDRGDGDVHVGPSPNIGNGPGS